MVGKLNADHWYCYVQHRESATRQIDTDQTLEILMTGLDPAAQALFYPENAYDDGTPMPYDNVQPVEADVLTAITTAALDGVSDSDDSGRGSSRSLSADEEFAVEFERQSCGGSSSSGHDGDDDDEEIFVADSTLAEGQVSMNGQQRGQKQHAHVQPQRPQAQPAMDAVQSVVEQHRRQQGQGRYDQHGSRHARQKPADRREKKCQ